MEDRSVHNRSAVAGKSSHRNTLHLQCVRCGKTILATEPHLHGAAVLSGHRSSPPTWAQNSQPGWVREASSIPRRLCALSDTVRSNICCLSHLSPPLASASPLSEQASRCEKAAVRIHLLACKSAAQVVFVLYSAASHNAILGFCIPFLSSQSQLAEQCKEGLQTFLAHLAVSTKNSRAWSGQLGQHSVICFIRVCTIGATCGGRSSGKDHVSNFDTSLGHCQDSPAGSLAVGSLNVCITSHDLK